MQILAVNRDVDDEARKRMLCDAVVVSSTAQLITSDRLACQAPDPK